MDFPRRQLLGAAAIGGTFDGNFELAAAVEKIFTTTKFS
jgi:hypothetical protein